MQKTKGTHIQNSDLVSTILHHQCHELGANGLCT